MFLSYRKCTSGDMTLFGDQSFNPFIWVIPSMLDIFGTSLMYVGLTWTYAASYQILRASGMIITAVLSVSFFGTKVTVSHVIGMIFVGVGLVVVCVGDYVFFNGGGSGLDKNTVLAGDLIIIIAQLVMSLQMILQEKIIKKYKNSANSSSWLGKHIWNHLNGCYSVPNVLHSMAPTSVILLLAGEKEY